MPGTVVTTSIGVAAYRVVEMAVEAGVQLGWRRAHKHTDTPEEAAILAHIERAVMNELSEWLVFPDAPADSDRGSA